MCLLGNKFCSRLSYRAAIFDGGIGYRFSPFFRVDVIASYVPLRFSGINSNDVGLNNPFSFTANIRPLVGMINGYIDLAPLDPSLFRMVQPFVTGGVGI